MQFDAKCWALSALLRDLLDAPTALAACCEFDLCHKYILYLYLYAYAASHAIARKTRRTVSVTVYIFPRTGRLTTRERTTRSPLLPVDLRSALVEEG